MFCVMLNFNNMRISEENMCILMKYILENGKYGYLVICIYVCIFEDLTFPLYEKFSFN